MAITNSQRITQAFDILKEGLNPFVAQQMEGGIGTHWWTHAQARYDRMGSTDPKNIDVLYQLRMIVDNWNNVFKYALGNIDRNFAGELLEFRHRWAHQETFSYDDTARMLDTAARLLTSVGAGGYSEAVTKIRNELFRTMIAEQRRNTERKAAAAPVAAGSAAAGLTPWREIIAPHPDVASGRYQTAEFAADLSQVHAGRGADEYRDPAEFFRRTFLTQGLESLLAGALQRMAGSGGDPVIELQTNFGGGKTHAMLAVYHLFSGAPAEDLAGLEAVIARAGGLRPERAARAVLVGTAISPGQPRVMPDGTEARTLWGDLAWQLGGAAGYALVADADRTGVSPGSEALRTLFERHGPALVLIDELIAYIRQLYTNEDLPAGSFDANLTFMQALTEAARQAPRTLVVASLPASDIETGGEGGRAALERLRNIFGRMQSPWRPASTEEGFEIVRRRLFEPIADKEKFAARDAVVNAYAKLYAEHTGDFPPHTREPAYRKRLESAYPIHPELFDRLYTEWSTLDKFQRTRGVLRLMASVIHELWESGDRGLTIMPASVPVGDLEVQAELTRYLDDPWVPVIERDVDGPNSLPLQMDAETNNFGRYSAARRVARTLYLGTAPTLRTGHAGIDDRSVKLGSAQPGETVATFGDALRRLADQATHLYVNDGRYWFNTQPSVNRLAQDRAAAVEDHKVLDFIVQRVRDLTKSAADRGEFPRLSACVTSSADVPDERETRLVILSPEHPHSRDEGSKARQAAAAILNGRGESPRRYQNALVFLAADRARLADLEQAVRQAIAWESIDDEAPTLNLDAFQAAQAKTKRAEADRMVQGRIPETFQWLLAPEQEPNGPIEWREARLTGDDPLAVRAWRKLKAEGLVADEFGAVNLRQDLDEIPLWRDGDHVGIMQLVNDYAQYPYLQRLKDPGVLLTSIARGAGAMLWETDTFAWAERFDPTTGTYRGLRAGAVDVAPLDEHAVVVRSEAAKRQLDATLYARREERTATGAIGNGRETYSPGRPDGADGETGGAVTIEARPRPKRRFYGTVEVGQQRPIPALSEVIQEVVQHLSALPGAQVRITLDIAAEAPGGVPDDVVRTVSENSRVLKFTQFGFEEE